MLNMWGKRKWQNSGQKIKETQRRLEEVQTGYRDAYSAEMEKRLEGELGRLWRQEELYWKQRAGIRWLKEGDKNTKFFHASTIQRRQKNRILKLKTDDLLWIEEEEEIARHIKSFYENLFTAREEVQEDEISNWIPSVITEEMNRNLCRPITDEEIKNAVFQMGPNKSPGPDGFPGFFYQKYWELVKQQLCAEVKRFFANTEMPEGWNDTHVVIIPKVPNPETVSQFRPISCCNFRYKIISKIMATRLKEWLPNIISELQAAFTKGRAIQDNIMIVHEVIHYFKNKASKYQWDMMIKMDMMKAYDMVDWRCLENILRTKGFESIWCDWIMECVRTVKFSILVNGVPTEQFTPTRGIRQGDPISPFLFIILSNSLSILINKKGESGAIKGVKLNPRCPTLTHVLFADDTILFGEASVTEAMAFKKTMELYGQMTGQKVNHQKSSIMFSRKTPDALQTRIRSILGFHDITPFGKYLGVPSEWGRSKKEVFEFLLTRMRNLGESWKSLMLSPGGKEVLLKAVYQSIPTYIMSCFLLPKTITNKMDSLLRAFFWGGSMTKRSIHWSSKEKLTRAKGVGGLGFKDFRTFNMALLAKQGWRLLTNGDLLWARLLKALYFPTSDFLQASKTRRPSWIWASLCDSREVLTLGARKNLISGRQIRIFTDPWIPSIPGFRLNRQGNDDMRADEWINEEGTEWNLEEVSEYCNQTEINAIMRIPVGTKDGSDSWVWHFDKNGMFSVKSAYHALRGDHNMGIPMESRDRKWKWLWNLEIPPKFKFFIWRASNNALATARNLWRRKCGDSPVCQLCQRHEENIIHCLFECSHSAQTWRKLIPAISLPEEYKLILDWIFENRNINVPDFLNTVIAGMWCIWKARNEYIFRQTTPSIESTAMWTSKIRNEWKKVVETEVTRMGNSRQGPDPMLSPPPEDCFHQQIYCDGSFIDESVEAGYGVVVINSHG
ncbi:LINE-1 retrotransposable element ORF2 protein [Linum perenne]